MGTILLFVTDLKKNNERSVMVESSREELSDVFVAVETLNLFQGIRHSLCSLFCPLKRGNNVLRVGPRENPPVYSHFLYVFGVQDTLTAFYNAAQHSLTHAHRRANQKQITLYVSSRAWWIKLPRRARARARSEETRELV